MPIKLKNRANKNVKKMIEKSERIQTKNNGSSRFVTDKILSIITDVQLKLKNWTNDGNRTMQMDISHLTINPPKNANYIMLIKMTHYIYKWLRRTHQ